MTNKHTNNGDRNKQPLQPIYLDGDGVARFRENALVRYILDNGSIDLNHLAGVDFPVDDQEQFAQLIGYSVGGFSELSYVTDATYDEAVAIVNDLVRTIGADSTGVTNPPTTGEAQPS